MNENYYIYYIVPDSNFASETETDQNSSNGFEQIGNIIRSNILLILLILLLIYMFKQI